MGSPLLFSAYLVMGHSVAAGFAGVMLVGIAAILDDRSVRWVAPTALAAAGLVLVRSEGTIMVLATCLTLVAMSVRWRPWRLQRRGLALGGGLAAVGAAAFLLNDLVVKAVSSDLITETGSVVDQTGPVSAAWVNLLRPWYGTGGAATSTAAFIAVAFVLAALAVRLIPKLTLLPLALLVLSAVAAVARQLEAIDLISGLLPAFPVVVAVMLIGRRDLLRPDVGRLALLSAATTLGLVLTVYGDMDGAQWEGASSRSCSRHSARW